MEYNETQFNILFHKIAGGIGKDTHNKYMFLFII